jgi:hypothetical protein
VLFKHGYGGRCLGISGVPRPFRSHLFSISTNEAQLGRGELRFLDDCPASVLRIRLKNVMLKTVRPNFAFQIISEVGGADLGVGIARIPRFVAPSCVCKIAWL